MLCNFLKLECDVLDNKLVPSLLSRFLLVLKNTLAFFITELITAAISVMIQAPGNP